MLIRAPRMELSLTAERLSLESEAEAMLKEWLQARVTYLIQGGDARKAMGEDMDLLKARKNHPRPMPRTGIPGNWSSESASALEDFQAELRERYRGRRVPDLPLPETVFHPGDHYARQHRGRNRRPTIAAGQQVFEEIIDRAYQLGLKEAASALLRDRDPPREYQHYTRRKLQILARTNVKLVDATTRRMVRNIESHGKPDTVDELLHKLYSTARCQGIAIDQVSKGYIRGAAEVLRQRGYRYIYWRTMMDEKVCPVCGPRESQPFTILDFLKRAPAHPRCLPGYARVSAQGVTATTERRYEGDLVIISTASGYELSCTPNHPILTPGGWIAAGLLDVGGYVISHAGIEWKIPHDHNGQDGPPSIQEVAEGFGRSLDVAAVEVPVSALDFHGDGVGSDVAVIRADRLLFEFLRFGQASDLDTGILEAIDTNLARQIIDGSAGEIFADEVISIERKPWHGVVYNLQTESGAYVAEGIYTHNCRCWPSTTRFDGSRDPDLHAKSVLVAWDQAILRRRRT